MVKKNYNSAIIVSMSIFSLNNDPVVVPVETTEEPLEVTEDHYADVSEEDYTTVEEPDFGDDV